MGRVKQASSADTRPLGDQKSWARTNGTYLAGRAYIDGADETACEMETKWGADRLRLLVSTELREKFDRQRDDARASLARAEGRKAVMYTLEKIGRLLSIYPDIAKVKISFLAPRDRDQAQARRRYARCARGQQGRSLLAVQYGLSQRDYHKRRKIEQPEMA